jgi:hypothetical protein
MALGLCIPFIDLSKRGNIEQTPEGLVILGINISKFSSFFVVHAFSSKKHIKIQFVYSFRILDPDLHFEHGSGSRRQVLREFRFETLLL